MIQPPPSSIRAGWWQARCNGDLRHTILIVQVEKVDRVGESIVLFLLVEQTPQAIFEPLIYNVNHTVEG